MGCCRQMGPLEQVQMRVARIFLGLGRRYPRVALQYEMMMLPLIWEVRRRCIKFWLKVIGMDDRRLIWLVALEAQEPRNKVKWWKDLKCGLEKIGWTSEEAEKLNGVVSGSKVSQMLKDLRGGKYEKSGYQKQMKAQSWGCYRCLWEEGVSQGVCR